MPDVRPHCAHRGSEFVRSQSGENSANNNMWATCTVKSQRHSQRPTCGQTCGLPCGQTCGQSAVKHAAKVAAKNAVKSPAKHAAKKVGRFLAARRGPRKRKTPDFCANFRANVSCQRNERFAFYFCWPRISAHFLTGSSGALFPTTRRRRNSTVWLVHFHLPPEQCEAEI